MPQNVEIKAVVEDLPKLVKVAKMLSSETGEVLNQKDVFYNCHDGRLKLRTIGTEDDKTRSELIFYRRPDELGPKISDFCITPVTDAEGMDQVLSASLGKKGVIKKQRILYMIGQTRLHVDKVDNLGNYMELEVQLKEGQSLEEGAAIADDLMAKLGIEPADLVTGAYFDLIMNGQKGSQE